MIRSCGPVVAAPLALLAIVVACGSGDVATQESADASADVRAGDGEGDAGPIRSPHGLDARPANTTCLAPPRPAPAGPVKLERVYPDFVLSEPITMTQRPGDGSRWYVTSRTGAIVSFPSAGTGAAPTAVADLNVLGGATVISESEGGFLGFTFHPRFAQNGRAYVYWTDEAGDAHIAYLTSTDGGLTFSQHTNVLTWPRTSAHCGGGLAFGRDGFLYASFGDGGSTFRGQRTDDLYAKVIRIDVDTPPVPPATYVIPDGNPFKSGGGEPAAFAYGFRNPFRLSVDRATGDIWLGDVGEAGWEEINVVKASGNYGWPCREGAHDHRTTAVDPVECPSMLGLTDPVAEIAHTPSGSARAITGGVVYRGKAIPELVGSYIFGDSSSKDIFSLSFDVTTAAPVVKVLNADGSADGRWVYFAEDLDGEIYALGFDGPIYKLVPAGLTTSSPFPDRLSRTGCVEPSDPKTPAASVLPYRVNAQLWSDGAEKERYFAIPDGTAITVREDGDLDLPSGSVVMKTFSVDGVRVETRLLVRHADGEWAGYAYEWNDAQTDATLLSSNTTKQVGARSWTIPSRAECVRCHTAAAGRTLGLELAQLNGDFLYGATNRIANQLTTLEHIGIFDKPLGKVPADISRYPDPLGVGPVDARARAYLHANCAHCHRPDNPLRTQIDLRFSTSFKDTKTCGETTKVSDLGIPGAAVLAPEAPERSLISLRSRATNIYRMPPLATNIVDVQGISVVDQWIREVTACP